MGCPKGPERSGGRRLSQDHLCGSLCCRRQNTRGSAAATERAAQMIVKFCTARNDRSQGPRAASPAWGGPVRGKFLAAPLPANWIVFRSPHKRPFRMPATTKASKDKAVNGGLSLDAMRNYLRRSSTLRSRQATTLSTRRYDRQSLKRCCSPSGDVTVGAWHHQRRDENHASPPDLDPDVRTHAIAQSRWTGSGAPHETTTSRARKLNRSRRVETHRTRCGAALLTADN